MTNEERRLKAKLEFENIILETDGYKLLSEYINNKVHVKMLHNCGHVYKVSPYNFLSGYRCPKCGILKRSKLQSKIGEKKLIELIDSLDDYQLLSEYKNNKTKVKIKHLTCGNIYEVRPDCFIYHSNRCPHCQPNSSKFEREIQSYTESMIEIEKNKWFFFKKKKYELDIYIPTLKVGIECDGVYWHSENKKSKNYHINKQKWFMDNFGIQVLFIREHEWDNNKEEIKQLIKETINKNYNFELGNELVLDKMKYNLDYILNKGYKYLKETSPTFEIVDGLKVWNCGFYHLEAI